MQPTPPAGDGTPNPFSPVFWVDTYVILNALGGAPPNIALLAHSERQVFRQPACGLDGCRVRWLRRLDEVLWSATVRDGSVSWRHGWFSTKPFTTIDSSG